MRWSVGILEKAILRWRRKRTGLRFLDHLPHRGLPAEVVLNPTDLCPPVPPLELGDVPGDKRAAELWLHADRSRGEREAALSGAVEKVADMVRSDEARAQYSRLKEAETSLRVLPAVRVVTRVVARVAARVSGV